MLQKWRAQLAAGSTALRGLACMSGKKVYNVFHMKNAALHDVFGESAVPAMWRVFECFLGLWPL
jgi:hypothetical protein